MKGIDVSSVQGIVPWHTLSDIDFGFIKVTEGEGYTSPQWINNAINIHVERKIRGFYLFSRPGLNANTPEGEAAYFYSKIEPFLIKGDLIACDIEKTEYTTAFGTSNWSIALLSHLEYLSGYKPFIYSYPEFIKKYLLDKKLSRWPLWLAWYEDALPKSFAQWKTISLWQRGPGKVRGMPGQVDLDVFFLDAPHLESYGKP